MTPLSLTAVFQYCRYFTSPKSGSIGGPILTYLLYSSTESILKEKSVTFGARTEQYYTPSPQVPSSPADTAPALVQPRKPVQTKPVVQPAVQHQVQPLVQHQVQPPADSHIPQG